MLRAPWECFDDAAAGVAVAQASAPELPRSPAARRELAYEARKAELSRAWISPVRAPWGLSTRSPQWPQTWNTEPVDPVETVTTPAAVNPRKGAGISAAEIEAWRAVERAAFAERLRERWRSNLFHL